MLDQAQGTGSGYGALGPVMGCGVRHRDLDWALLLGQQWGTSGGGVGHPVLFVHVVVHQYTDAVHHIQARIGTVSVVTSRALSTPSLRAEALYQKVTKGADCSAEEECLLSFRFLIQMNHFLSFLPEH